ncbi:hypothetical protein EDC04DRAFT_2609060 [Pisolithus marmoratus]|nr:hypothetical protein EDC04DRAFT_2609060 [Pisolithus marmoratus]
MDFEKKVIRLGIKAPVFCMDIDVSANLWAIGVGNQVNITAADNQDYLPPPKVEAKYTDNDLHVRPLDKTVAWHVKPPSISQITLQDGLCLYKLGGKKAIWIWDHEPGRSVQCPSSVAFLHGGRAVVSGATTGNVRVWNTDSKDLYQVLPHGGDIMQAVVTYQQGAGTILLLDLR